MKEWIGYYKDIVSHETCDSIMSEDWKWKASTYSSNKGEIEDSSNRVVMDDCWIQDGRAEAIYVNVCIMRPHKIRHLRNLWTGNDCREC